MARRGLNKLLVDHHRLPSLPLLLLDGNVLALEQLVTTAAHDGHLLRPAALLRHEQYLQPSLLASGVLRHQEGALPSRGGGCHPGHGRDDYLLLVVAPRLLDGVRRLLTTALLLALGRLLDEHCRARVPPVPDGHVLDLLAVGVAHEHELLVVLDLLLVLLVLLLLWSCLVCNNRLVANHTQTRRNCWSLDQPLEVNCKALLEQDHKIQ
jgi:hypothetical protein